MSEITRSWLDDCITTYVKNGKPPRNDARDHLIERLKLIASIYPPGTENKEQLYPAHQAAQVLSDLAGPALIHWQAEHEREPSNQLAKTALAELSQLLQLVGFGVVSHIEVAPTSNAVFRVNSAGESATYAKKRPKGSKQKLCDDVARLFAEVLAEANNGKPPGLSKDGPVTKLTAAFMCLIGWSGTTPGSVEKLLERMIRSPKPKPRKITTNVQ